MPGSGSAEEDGSRLGRRPTTARRAARAAVRKKAGPTGMSAAKSWRLGDGPSGTRLLAPEGQGPEGLGKVYRFSGRLGGAPLYPFIRRASRQSEGFGGAEAFDLEMAMRAPLAGNEPHVPDDDAEDALMPRVLQESRAQLEAQAAAEPQFEEANRRSLPTSNTAPGNGWSDWNQPDGTMGWHTASSCAATEGAIRPPSCVAAAAPPTGACHSLAIEEQPRQPPADIV